VASPAVTSPATPNADVAWSIVSCQDTAVILPGYLEGFVPAADPSALVDATASLVQPLVWSALLYAVGGAREAVDALDVDPADVEELLTQLTNPDRWPAFTLELAGGRSVHLVSRNFEDDSGWDYLLTGSEFTKPVALAMLEGHFRGPALSWPELIAVADQAATAVDRAQRILLLVPALGDDALPADAEQTVADAVAGVDACGRHAAVAEELLTASRRFWGTPAGTSATGSPLAWATTAYAVQVRRPTVVEPLQLR
jgi:hypothetical protein